MRRVCRLILFASLLAIPLHADAQVNEEKPQIACGVTLDLLPTLLSASAGEMGGAAQVWGARDHWKARIVGAALTLPDGMDGSEAFDKKRLRVVALIVDYTFGEDHDGLWVGAGAERWFSSIEHVGTGGRQSWQESVATVGGGYIWYFGKLEVNPWFAFHYSLDPAEFSAAGERYSGDPFSAEVSLKLGWRFK